MASIYDQMSLNATPDHWELFRSDRKEFAPSIKISGLNISESFWGGSRGGSGGSVEPPKLNVKTYSKGVVKKKE